MPKANGRERLAVRLKPGEDGLWTATEARFGPLAAEDGSVVLRTLPFDYYSAADGVLPDFGLVRARRSRDAIGKAIVFARTDVVVEDTRSWLADETVRDVPRPGEHIAAGQPICTVFAAGGNAEVCLGALKQRAHQLLETNS